VSDEWRARDASAICDPEPTTHNAEHVTHAGGASRQPTTSNAGSGGPKSPSTLHAGVGRVVLLAVILVAVTATAVLSAIVFLYSTSLNQTRSRLREYAQSQARLIEEISRHEQRYAHIVSDPSHGSPRQAILKQIADAHAAFAGAGRTGEFKLAERIGDSIVYLLRHRGPNESFPMSIPFSGKAGAPMRRVLSGKSGTMIGLDYRGIRVVAAYEPLSVFGWGAEAKIDLAEVQAPFVHAGFVAALIALGLVLVGTLLFFRVTNPVLRRLRESEERYRGVFDNSPLGIYRTTPDGRVLVANPALLNMLGYASLPELAGRNLERNGFEPSYPRSKFKQVIERDGEVVGLEGAWRRQDGTVLYLRENARAVRDADGRTLYYDGTVEDITERKRAEEERERLNRQLLTKTAELEQLVYAASHDLRAPLVTVRGFVGELHRSLGDLATEFNRTDATAADRERLLAVVEHDIPREMKYIEAGTARMEALLSGLLKLSRLGRATPRPEELDMDSVVAEVLRSVEFAAREVGAVIDSSDLPRCVGDRTMVGQVLANLIENAIKYRSPDRPPVLAISGRLDGERAVYCVEDNGVGIDGESRQRVFEPFYQVEPKQSAGEGLGLTIVARSMTRMGGSVWMESEEGKGSRFFFSLPAAGR